MFRTKGGFLRRLRSDTAGNTLAIVGAALIPITAMIGSGLDVSRAYMAKSRLQSACDAASLAARRVMRNDDLTSDVVDTGRQFFDFNFQQGMYQTEAFEPEITRPDTGLVRVSASTRIPTTIMRLFGFETLPLNVSCDASLNFVNTDVVLVLDVTGSMLCRPTEASCNVNHIRSDSKMAALQDAVIALYDELEPVQTQLRSQGLRLRYGIVPYSSTVNVGRLLDSDYIRNSAPYQTRVATFSAQSHVAKTPTSTGAWEYYNGNSAAGQSTSHPTATLNSSQCQSWVAASSVNGGGPAPTATTRTTYSGNSSGGGYSASTNRGWSGAPLTGSCRRWKTVTTTTYETVRSFPTSGTRWNYRQETLDTSTFKQPGGVMPVATNATGTIPNSAGSGPFNPQQLGALVSGGSTSNVTWNGCIEERATDDSIRASSGLTIPNRAYDLNINHIPDSDDTRWSPMLPEVLFTRPAGSSSWTPGSSSNNSTSTTNWMMNYAARDGYTACPTEARRLAEWSRDDLDDYVGSLWPVGGTYHDVGMIWGARFISTGGVFADGCEEYNRMPCNRHVIFMTDGDQTTYCNVYTAYGIEQNDMRTSPPGCSTTSQAAQQLANHQQRFQMICNATKNMNVSVWVIAFGTSLNTSLVNCASNAGQASTSSNRDQLISRFRQIGNQIGALRLTR